MRARAAVLTVTGCLAATACSVTPADVGIRATCRASSTVDNRLLVLMAQSVPTAELIPCVKLVPAGWSLGDLDVGEGKSRFWLNSDRDGPGALRVTLTRSCDVRGATRVPSDEAAASRFERTERVTTGYAGDRYYVFAGGCATYHYDLRGTSRAEPINDTSVAVGFVTRAAVADSVRRRSQGRLHLDPTPGGSP